MAAGVTTESVLGTIKGHLECSICCTRYQDPKMLHCSHSFCLKCLQELKRKQNPDDDKIKCPLCQRESILPEGGVTNLTNNYALIGLMEDVTKQEQLLQDEGSKVICQACDEENEAISKCMDCMHYLCQECQKAHKRLLNMKTHKIVSLADLQKEFLESTKNNAKCEIHPYQKLCLYCNTCEQMICELCTTSGHKKPMHNFVDLETATAISLKGAHELATRVDRCESFKETKINTNWDSMRNRLNIMLAMTKRQISQKAEMEVAKIRQKETKLLQNAQATFKDKKLAELTFAKQTMERVQTEMTENSCFEILEIRQNLLHDYKDVTSDNVTYEDVTYDLSFIGFEENDTELGTLLLEERWELLSGSDVKSKTIASLSTGDMVIATQGKITKLGSNGKVLYIKSTDNIQDPTSIATNKDDYLLVLDRSTVKTFNKEYQLLHQFTPGKESDGKPTCLAVDDSGLIAVGYQNKGELSLHNPDGTLIRRLLAPKINEHLTISNNRLIYISNSYRILASIDFMGNNIFTLNTANAFILYGLCCDKAGDIYVISYNENTSQYGINHYSADGKCTDYFVRIKNIYSTITLTTDGKLAMTGPYVHTEIYHRV